MWKTRPTWDTFSANPACSQPFGSLPNLARVAIYLAFGVSLLMALSALVTSLILVVHADDLSRYRVTNIYKMDEEHAGMPFVESVSGRSEFSVDTLAGEYRFLRMPRVLAVWVGVEGIIYAFLFFVAVTQLANLFEEICAGRPFEPTNVRRICRIGLSLMGMPIVRAVAQLGGLAIFWNDIHVPGTALYWDLLRYELQPGLLLAGLVVLGAAEVFRAGARLQEEQELTV
jgi:hypothetical protein